MTFLHFLTLILQFDGSLRKPQDPNSQIIPTQVNSLSVPPLASCSFALLADSEDVTGNANNTLLELKGKALYGQQMSSADVEYEGLLLGLNAISNDPTFVTSSNEIRIQGDCKTVIDQLNGISLPRKQRLYYTKAKELIHQIERDYGIIFSFQHVSRDSNQLCDYACFKIIQVMQWKYIVDFNNTLYEIVQDSFLDSENSSNSSDKEEIMLLLSKKKRMTNKKSVFANLISRLDSSRDCSSHIPISIRPYWLCQIFFHAERLKDYVAFRLIGEKLVSESKQWKKIGKHHEISQSMEMMGYKLILASFHHFKLHNEADKIIKKLHSFSSYIGNNIGDDDSILLCQSIETLQKKLPSWHELEVNLLDNPSLPAYFEYTSNHEMGKIIEKWFESMKYDLFHS